MTSPTLTLYHRPGCSYCTHVLREADALGVPMRRVDIWEQPEARRHLLQARGRATVPVLGIVGDEGETLLPESRAIVAYLRQLVTHSGTGDLPSDDPGQRHG